MPNGERSEMNYRNCFNIKTSDYGKRNIKQRFVNNGFHPMVAKMRGKTHFLDGMVQFMEIPKPRNSVEQAVRVPLHKICNQKENQKTQPKR
jgi:hypothetical protein